MKKYQVKLINGHIDTLWADCQINANYEAQIMYGSENIEYVQELN